MITPLEFIALVREIYPDRYAEGSNGCLKFHKLLAAVFPDSHGYYNSDHVITEIDGDFYDVDGVVEQFGGYLPLEEYGQEFIENVFTETLHLEQTG